MSECVVPGPTPQAVEESERRRPYIKFVFEDLVNVIRFDTTVYRHSMYNGAKRKSVSVVLATELLRFETAQQLDAFGDTF